MSLIDVRSFGAKPDDPTFDNAPAIMTALRKMKSGGGIDSVYLPDAVPGAPSIYWCKTSVLHDNGGLSGAILGDGKTRVKFVPNVPVNTNRGANGSIQGRHLAAIGNFNVLTMHDVSFDFNGAQQLAVDASGAQVMVGDTLRVTKANVLRATNVLQYNQRGLTTKSSANLQETFAFQMLGVLDFVLDGCHQLALDGAPTATGIVAHWSSGVIKNTTSAFVRGQGFGTYGNSTVRYESCWAHGDGHSFNFEGGNVGPQDITIGVAGDPTKDCISSGSNAAIVMNGNPIPIHSLTVNGLSSTGDHSVLLVTGTLPTTRPQLNRLTITDPQLNVVNLLAGTSNASWLGMIDILNSKIHNGKSVPIVAPKSLAKPSSWQLAAF